MVVSRAFVRIQPENSDQCTGTYGYCALAMLKTRRYEHHATRARSAYSSVSAAVVTKKLRAALDEAEAFVSHMPTGKLGLLFLQAGTIVQPEPDQLDRYQTHAGQLRGHWPASADITSAMFERYKK